MSLHSERYRCGMLMSECPYVFRMSYVLISNGERDGKKMAFSERSKDEYELNYNVVLGNRQSQHQAVAIGADEEEGRVRRNAATRRCLLADSVELRQPGPAPNAP